jgi:oxygen-independent coproporphyrinogen-3 oxidase
MSFNEEPFSLYVHLPYCVRKCPYCDFNSHVVRSIPEKEYRESLVKELDVYARSDAWRGRGLATVFFGGGTPSLFSPGSIGQILEKAASLFPLQNGAEITLEANPGSVESARFAGYRSCGVNRISLGAQSFQPRLLSFLGRAHSVDETRLALKIIEKVGFDNFSLDLIYAVPGESMSDLENDLAESLAFHSPHLSAYNLTLEEGTPFYREWRAGNLQPLAEETEIAMAEWIEESAGGAGLTRYEISNYARPGYHSRHNTNYWEGGDYLGIGAGAHSYKRTDGSPGWGHRWNNEKSPAVYMRNVGLTGQAVAGEERASFREAAGEFMFLGLRMTRGISEEAFARRFGKRPEEVYPQLGEWMAEGFIEKDPARLKLTRRGLLVANSIFTSFL